MIPSDPDYNVHSPSPLPFVTIALPIPSAILLPRPRASAEAGLRDLLSATPGSHLSPPQAMGSHGLLQLEAMVCWLMPSRHAFVDGEQVARVVRALIYSFLASSQTQLLDFSVLHIGFVPSLPSMFPRILEPIQVKQRSEQWSWILSPSLPPW